MKLKMLNVEKTHMQLFI